MAEPRRLSDDAEKLLEVLARQTRMLDSLTGYEYANSTAGLVDMLREIRPIKLAVEVGSFQGVSTHALSLFCETLYAVDPHDWQDWCHDEQIAREQDVRGKFLGRLRNMPNVRYLQSHSVPASRAFDDQSLDLVYLDGSHRLQDVINDVNAWLPKIKHGGFLTGHDYIPDDAYDFISVMGALNATIGKPDKVYSDTSWLWRIR